MPKHRFGDRQDLDGGSKVRIGSRYDVRDLASIELGRDEVLIHIISAKPQPTRWPTFLAMRPDGAVWSNGTGAGFTRLGCLEAGFVNGQDYRRLKARDVGLRGARL